MKQPRVRVRRAWGTFAVVFIGVSLVQLAWALVVPPFRGADEHDHAFRAGAVAQGEWLPDYIRVTVGRGDIVTPPGHLVTAAKPICSALPYTKHDDCNAIATLEHGRVQVGSAAARYNPGFYWLMGTAARPWHGSEALYAMRAVGAVASGLLLASAFTVTRRWARSVWPGTALLIVLTPTATYTTSMAAPNGVELGGAILLWSCLLGLLQAQPSSRGSSLFVGGAVAGTIPLVTVRSMGPLWFVLILGTWLLLAGTLSHRVLASVPRPRLAKAAVAVALALIAGVSWTLAAGTNNPGIEPIVETGSPWPRIPLEVLVWPLQVISVAPLRFDSSPPLVYALVVTLFLMLGFAGWRYARTRVRLAMAVTLTLSLVVPVTLTVVAFATYGSAWQGRYGWPYTLGFMLMAGMSLQTNVRLSAAPVSRAVASGVAAMMLVATLTAQLAVLRHELLTSTLAHDSSWIKPSSLLVVALTGTGFLLLAVATSAKPPALKSPGISSEGNRQLASAHDLAP